MWLFTVNGFFSVVQHKDRPNRIIVRSRVYEDLARFCGYLPDPDSAIKSIDSNSGTDYAHRIIVKRKHFVSAMVDFAEEVDYPNFKDEVHHYSKVWKEGDNRNSVYFDIWRAAKELQELDQPELLRHRHKMFEIQQDPSSPSPLPGLKTHCEYFDVEEKDAEGEAVQQLADYWAGSLGNQIEVDLLSCEGAQYIVVRCTGSRLLSMDEIQGLSLQAEDVRAAMADAK